MLAPPPRALTRSRQKVVLVTAFVTGLVEIAGLLGILPRFRVGRLLLSPSIVPALVVLAMLGRRAAGRARDIDAAAVYWVTALAGICFSTILLDRDGHLLDSLAIVLAALDEEIVYRFAVPTVVAGILLVFHVPSRPSRVVGLVVAGIWFVLLPGHRVQMHSAADVLPFIAFATLAAIVVYRSGSILATTATHAVMNMLTIIAFGGAMSQADAQRRHRRAAAPAHERLRLRPTARHGGRTAGRDGHRPPRWRHPDGPGRRRATTAHRRAAPRALRGRWIRGPTSGRSGRMDLIRRAARPMLASIFISGGIDTIRNPKYETEVGGDVATDIADAAPVDLPQDPETLVMIDAGVKIAGGLLLASGGRLARIGALACAASLIPTTWAASPLLGDRRSAGAGPAAGPLPQEPGHPRRAADRRRRHGRPALAPVARRSRRPRAQGQGVRPAPGGLTRIRPRAG